MNFLDAYEIAPRAPTPNPADAPLAPSPSLNEEVNEVIGQLGRFWGGFRKQSQTALQAARKDLGEVVVQAQKELAKLTAPEEAAEGSGSAAADAGAAPRGGAEGSADAAAGPSATADGEPSSSGAAAAPEGTSTTEEPATLQHTRSSSLSAQNLFARLQSALPPAVVQTMQENLATVQTNLASVQTNIQTNFAQVQTNLTHTDLASLRAQAEELALRSEARLLEAVREAGDVLRDAVKVVPPEEADESGTGVPLLGSTPGLAWDGADMWMLPSAEGSRRASTSSRGGGSGGAGSLGPETQSAVATRAEALLRRLAREPEIVRHDPEVEEGVRERYHAWRATEVDNIEGGLEGAVWAARIEKAREDPADGATVMELEANLVPSEMTKDVFWLRFFFRTHQIRAEEEKRKALLQSTADNDEDFSWEDEDEEESGEPSLKNLSSKAPTAKTPEAAQNPKLDVPGPTGATLTGTRRAGSADSFDLVSATSSVAGDAPPVAVPAPTTTEKKSAADEEEDSDWE